MHETKQPHKRDERHTSDKSGGSVPLSVISPARCCEFQQLQINVGQGFHAKQLRFQQCLVLPKFAAKVASVGDGCARTITPVRPNCAKPVVPRMI